MKKEMKIILPVYKMVYAFAFVVILSLIRDITWLYGKGLCICIGLILLLALPKIVRKRG